MNHTDLNWIKQTNHTDLNFIKQFGQLINISSHSLTIMNTVDTKFFSAEVWFTGQASKVLEKKDNVNLTLIIG